MADLINNHMTYSGYNSEYNKLDTFPEINDDNLHNKFDSFPGIIGEHKLLYPNCDGINNDTTDSKINSRSYYHDNPPPDIRKSVFNFRGMSESVRDLLWPGGRSRCLPNMKISPIYPEYETTKSRYESFFENWPKGFHKNAMQMAQSGFIYSQIGDKVFCFQCGIILHKWSPEDSIWEEHKNHSPNCHFVKIAGPVNKVI